MYHFKVGWGNQVDIPPHAWFQQLITMSHIISKLWVTWLAKSYWWTNNTFQVRYIAENSWNFSHTTKDMTEFPLISMKVSCHQLLCRRLLWKILEEQHTDRRIRKTSRFVMHIFQKNSHSVSKVHTYTNKKTHQWWKDFFSCSPGNRETTMCTGVTCSQCFTEIISWLFAGCTQFSREIGFFLLLLNIRLCQKFIKSIHNMIK